MKLKLIRSGGFAGRVKIVEEDLTSYPASLLQYLEKVFAEKKKASQGTIRQGSPKRDAFQYFVEYMGQQLLLEELEADAELAGVLKKLKDQL